MQENSQSVKVHEKTEKKRVPRGCVREESCTIKMVG